MESFGLWYKLHKGDKEQENSNAMRSESGLKENIEETVASESAELCENKQASKPILTPSFDLHANFWSEDIQITDDKIIGRRNNKPSHNPFPFLDIGIKIKDWKDIETITFHCPFDLKKDDITDLTSELREQETEELVFNDTCRPEISGDYCIVHVGDDGEEKRQRLLLFPLSLSDGNEN